MTTLRTDPIKNTSWQTITTQYNISSNAVDIVLMLKVSGKVSATSYAEGMFDDIVTDVTIPVP